MKITKEPFGALKDGTPITRYTMENEKGMRLSVINYGGAIQQILVPDRNGDPVDVVLGYDDIAGYEAGTSCFGAFVGRYANRIKDAAFELNGRRYQLEKNDGENHLHGTFIRTVFDIREQEDGLRLSHTFPDGEEGYPGSLQVVAFYRLMEYNCLELDYYAKSDADTVINLTNHSYFNLNGGGDVLDHRMMIFSGSFTEADEHTIPTGRVLPTVKTPMEFRSWKTIGRDFFADDVQLRQAHGYDHNYILREAADGINPGYLLEAAVAESDQTGISLSCLTTQPAMQFYTGNFVDKDSAPAGKGGVRYPKQGGFCLETQNYPCAPNYAQFPSAVLWAGKIFHQKTMYAFSVKE